MYTMKTQKNLCSAVTVLVAVSNKLKQRLGAKSSLTEIFLNITRVEKSNTIPK